MKKFFKEFKEFISRGNILDMAVGVIIGGAFSAIVTAFTNHIIRPLINWVIMLIVGDSEIAAYTFLHKVYLKDDAGVLTQNIDMESSIYIDWGAFISAIINFLLVALVLFLIIKAFNSVKQAKEIATNLKAKEAKGLPLTKREKKKLALIKEQEEKEAKALAEAEALALEEANKPTKEELLLTEIRDLLAKK